LRRRIKKGIILPQRGRGLRRGILPQKEGKLRRDNPLKKKKIFAL